MPDTIKSARQLIRSRLADLDAEAKQLERALASLGEGDAAKRRPGSPRRRRSARPAPSPGKQRGPRKPAATATSAPPKPKRPAARKPKRSKRAPRGQRREQFLAALAGGPGSKVSEIAEQLGISVDQTHALAKRLHKDGSIRKSGKGYRLAGSR